jgi:hypothetical protein
MQFENNLKALVQSHLQMLEQGQKIMPNPQVDPRMGSDANNSDEASLIKARVSEAISKNF